MQVLVCSWDPEPKSRRWHQSMPGPLSVRARSAGEEIRRSASNEGNGMSKQCRSANGSGDGGISTKEGAKQRLSAAMAPRYDVVVERTGRRVIFGMTLILATCI